MCQRVLNKVFGETMSATMLAMSACLVIAAGCGDGSDPNRVPLSGVVKLDGEPLEGATIRFFNDQDEVGMTTGSGGVYGIPIGALPGRYKVTISKLEGLDEVPEGLAVAANPQENPELLPPQFSSPQRTNLEFTVPEGGTESANFDLKTK